MQTAWYRFPGPGRDAKRNRDYADEVYNNSVKRANSRMAKDWRLADVLIRTTEVIVAVYPELVAPPWSTQAGSPAKRLIFPG